MRWLQRCCRQIRRDLLEAETPDEEHASERHPHLSEESLAAWMQLKDLGQGSDELIEILRDEFTAILETEAWDNIFEQSGTWQPDGLETKRSEADMKDAYYEELQATVNAASARVEPADAADARPVWQQDARPVWQQVEPDTIPSAQRPVLKKFGAARIVGGTILDPPWAENSRTLVREDSPWYIVAAFPKIFQTGSGDYWAFVNQRKQRGMDVSLKEWLFHILRWRDGRALRHPRFYFFAVNTLLRNKAVRGRPRSNTVKHQTKCFSSSLSGLKWLCLCPSICVVFR